MAFLDQNLLHITSSNVQQMHEQLRSLLNLYEQTFADYGPQFEPTNKLIGRLTPDDVLVSQIQPNTHLLGYFDDHGEALGGIIFEYYKKSRCGLMTYIFARDKGKGIGEFLINRGLEWMLNQIQDEVVAVFFETDNPNFFRGDAKTLIEINRKIRFFRHKANAKLIDIPYVQPALAPGMERAYSSLLMNLPRFGNMPLGVLMDKEIVMSFLEEFFNVLSDGENEGIFDPEKDWDLKRMKLCLDIEDIRENIDPFGLLAEPNAVKLYALYRKVWEDFLDDHRRKNMQLVIDTKRELDKILAGVSIQLDQNFFLKEIPSLRTPKLAVPSCSIAFHIAELGGFEAQPKYCPFFHSYEKDLFAQRYQQFDSPYQSQCHIKGKVNIRFSRRFEFTSEGRHEMTILLDSSTGTFDLEDSYTKTCQFNLSYTFFHNSENVVWGIVFQPDIGEHLNEFEIIQLSKYITGHHEKYLPQLEFRRTTDCGTSNQIVDRIFEFLSENYLRRVNAHLARVTPNHELKVKSGTIQIETSNCRFLGSNGSKLIDSPETRSEVSGVFGIECDSFWTFFFDGISTLHSQRDTDVKRFEARYSSIAKLENLLSTTCGFCTGIFDFERLEYEEIKDTIRPLPTSISEGTFEVMNRTLLISFCDHDKHYAAVKDSIGINPYLLIPNTVLAHNSLVADQLDLKIRREVKQSRESLSLTKRLFGNVLSQTYIRKSDVVRFIDTKVDFEQVGNVYQFPMEQALFDFGMEHRGIDAVFQRSQKYKANLEQELERISKARSELFELRITLLFLIMTFLQIAEMIGFTKRSPNLLFTTLAFTIVSIAYFIYRRFQSSSNNK